MFGEHGIQSMCVGDIGDDRPDGARRMLLRELDVHGVEAVFVAVEHDERGRRHAGNLPAQLAANRAAGAGHQHAASGDEASNGRGVETDRRARQQVLEIERLRVPEADVAVEPVPQPRQHFDRRHVGAERADDRAQQPWIRIPAGDEDLVGTMSGDDGRKI